MVEAAVLRSLVRELCQLIGAGVGTGRVVQPGRQTDGALLHRLAQHGPHVPQLRGRRLGLVPADGADAQSAVAHEVGEVDRWTQRIQAVEVALDAAPVVRPCLGRGAVEARVHVHQRLEVGGIGDRRVAEPVDADDLGGHALAHLRLVQRVGEDHQARMAVQIDEPRGDDQPVGVDAPRGRCLFTANHLQPAIADADVRVEARLARAVHDRAVLDDEIVSVRHRQAAGTWLVTGQWRSSVGG